MKSSSSSFTDFTSSWIWPSHVSYFMFKEGLPLSESTVFYKVYGKQEKSIAYNKVIVLYDPS